MKKISTLFTLILIGSLGFSQTTENKQDSIDQNTGEKIKVGLMSPIEIRAVRASKTYPFTQSLLLKRNIEKNNLGQDIPFLLNQVPGTVINSDAGNGVGYTGLRIRGTDASRINFTLNGIAYNDAESQGVFLVNLPDFLSSTNSIQVQRGVGTSSNGSGAFGATVNLLTNEVQDKAYATLSNSIGTYNTLKNTFKAGSGLINGQYSFDVRLSALKSDGYVDRAKSDLQSFYISAASIKEKSSLRLNVFSGKEKTYQAWYGVTEEQMLTDRRYNSAGTDKKGLPYDNETDNYTQTHYQLFYNKKFNSKWSFNGAVFATAGNGYYEQYKAGQKYSNYGLSNPVVNGVAITKTDLVRQLWLDNLYYGTNFSFQMKDENREIIVGGGNSQYDGNHVGKIIWAQNSIAKEHRWYDLDAKKTEQHVFGKWMEKIGKFHFFGDIQMRNVDYTIEGFRYNPTLAVNQHWLFINPKAGLRYTHDGYSSFISYAMANKEPNRDDFEAGSTNMPKHETLHDFEAGIEKTNNKLKVAATLYHMRYRNQLVLTGKINDVGAYTRTNIPSSYRTGLELETVWSIFDWLEFNNNVALSSNKVKNHKEYYDDYDAGDQKSSTYAKSNIAFSPSVVENATLSIRLPKNIEARIISKYVSRQYLDNTSRKDRSLDPYFVQDLMFNYTINPKKMKSIELILQVNNIWDKCYAPNGYTYSYKYGGELIKNNYYYPMAERNLMFGLNLNF